METLQVPIGALKTHPALQPRDPELLKQRDRVRQEEQSAMHVHDMAQLLKADPGAELVALKVAEVDGVLYVVDGHHRLKAYRRAKRETVPAQVAAMTLREASHASKLANITHTKLEMRPAQKRNALWHHLAMITYGGTAGLPEGESQQRLAGHFGVSRDTLQRMLRRLPEVDQTRFPAEHCDGITGWPHWAHVCSTRSGMYQAMPVDVRTRWREDRLLARLAKVIDREEPELVRSALRRWREEATEEEQKAIRGELEVAVWLALEDEGEAF